MLDDLGAAGEDVICLRGYHERKIAILSKTRKNSLLFSRANVNDLGEFGIFMKSFVERRDHSNSLDARKLAHKRPTHGATFRGQCRRKILPRETSTGNPFVNQNSHECLDKPIPRRCPIVPVMDVRGSVALHARAGRREDYLPVEGVLGHGADPLKLAKSMVEILGLNEIYVADLDAIAGASPNFDLIRALDEIGIMTWIDAGIKSGSARRKLQDAGADFIIVATETLPGAQVLGEIVAAGSVDRLVFSLDLKGGRSLVAPNSNWTSDAPIDLISEAAKLGISRFLLLETAGMGTGRGFGNADLIHLVRNRFPGAEIAVGGGVSGIEDVHSLLKNGIDRVLVGSALHDGRINRDALDRLGPITLEA